MNDEILLIDEEIVDDMKIYEDDDIQTTYLDNLEIVESECEIENVSNKR